MGRGLYFVRYSLLIFNLLAAGFSYATTYYVSPGGNDSNPGTQNLPFLTIQHASDVAVGADTVIVEAGTYAGAKFATSGTASQQIVFQGQTGAIVNAPGPLNTNNDNLWIRDASYITIEGFEVHSAPRAGIAVQGEPDAEVHGIIIQFNDCHDNTRWGIFTGYAEGIVISSNFTSYSAIEHGIYVSNSSDNPVIMGNSSHHNHACGIQINADPSLPGDGIISNALMDSNIIYENGVGGGAAINLASVTLSQISNNLLFDNHAGGIAGWDDGFDPAFGTHDNQFLNNTIVQAANGRFAVSFLNGSFNNEITNDILIHPGTRGSINVDSSSEPGLNSDYNVVVDVFSYNDGNTFVDLAEWQSRGHDAYSFISNTSALFVDAAASDYHLSATSPAIDTGTSVTGVPVDLDGVPRPQNGIFDIGAYEFIILCPGDTTPPTVSITEPADTDVVAGVIPFTASAVDDCAVLKVEFYVDSNLIGTVTTSPYSINWNTVSVSNGSHVLTTIAFDLLNHQASSAPINVTVNNSVLFFDDFEDNDASDWTFTRGTWTVTSGDLTGLVNSKGDARSPDFGGCTNCSIEADLRMNTSGSRVSLLVWYTDKKNMVEVRLMPDRGKVLLKQKSNGITVLKKSVVQSLSAGVDYHLQASYNGVNFQIFLNGLLILDQPAGAVPAGLVAFRIKSTNGASINASFHQIVVY
jgi:hypothetical protein